jgi:hypothetical protein
MTYRGHELRIKTNCLDEKVVTITDDSSFPGFPPLCQFGNYGVNLL